MTSFDRRHDHTPPSTRHSTRDRSSVKPLRTPMPIAPSHSVQCDAISRGISDRPEPSPAAILDYSIDAGHLRIEIKGALDLRCAFALLRIVKTVDDSIRSCVLDVSAVERVFDSGIAALILAANALTDSGVGKVEILGIDRDSVVLQPFRH